MGTWVTIHVSRGVGVVMHIKMMLFAVCSVRSL